LFTSGTSPERKRLEANKGLNHTVKRCDVLTTCGAKTAKQMKGIIGKKIGMTSIFGADGKQTACTIIEAGPCVVTQVKTPDTDGYTALQLAFGDKKEKHSNKAETNHFAKANTPAKSFVKEFRDYSIEKNIGETITVDIFAEGESVDEEEALEIKTKKK